MFPKPLKCSHSKIRRKLEAVRAGSSFTDIFTDKVSISHMFHTPLLLLSLPPHALSLILFYTSLSLSLSTTYLCLSPLSVLACLSPLSLSSLPPPCHRIILSQFTLPQTHPTYVPFVPLPISLHHVCLSSVSLLPPSPSTLSLLQKSNPNFKPTLSYF